MALHVKRMHSKSMGGGGRGNAAKEGGKDPYDSLWSSGVCVVGCGFRSQQKKELRIHLIVYHSWQ